MVRLAAVATSTTATSRSEVSPVRTCGWPLVGLLLLGLGMAPGAAVAQTATRQPVLPSAARLLGQVSWQQHEVALGVTLRRAWLPKLGPGPQSLCVLTIAPATARLRVAVPPRLQPTTQQATAAEALVAWNGGFFLPNGRPRGLRRSGGEVLSPPGEQSLATIAWRDREVLFGGSHDDWQGWPEVLEAGPHLVRGGLVVDHGPTQRKTRHPRTAMGVTADGTIVVVTADGRTALARGLSLEELGEVLSALGCVDAINLDGGGSTTLWAAAYAAATGGSGIANHPCDNRRFDAAGERAVADVVLLFGTRVVVVDDGELAVQHGGVRHDADGSGQLGATFAWAPAGDAVRARYRVKVAVGGRYRVERRSVVAPGLVDAAVQWFGAIALPSDGADAWQAVAERSFAAGEAELEVASLPGRPFVLDAVRLVAVP